MSARGKLITLEGIDGAGKSTHLTWLVDFFKRRSRAVVVTREPGGTALGEKLRELLLAPDSEMHRDTEALLMFAARREHIERVIEPALARGAWVLCDRFTDASFAYQGGGRGVDWEALHVLERWVQHGLQPDLTVFFDLAPELARARAAGVRSADRFEQEQQAFFERVRAAYLRRVEESAGRMVVVDAGQSVPAVQQVLAKIIDGLCP